MAISGRAYKIVWGQCAARCCVCKKEVLHVEAGRITSLTGEAAHIVGESDRAARGLSELTAAERNEPENLMLLCREHHKIVDDDPATYSVEKLHQLKADHFDWLTSSLAKLRPWRSNLSQLTYINVPRLSEQAELAGYKVDLSDYREARTLHSLGWDLNRVMATFQRVLAHLSVDAIPIQELSLHEGLVGARISFDRQKFRTKNIAMAVDAVAATPAKFTGNLAKDPHIYAKREDFRLILYIDETWITTSTAFMMFRPSSGQSIFSGLARITSVDYESRIMAATPWVIGLPSGPFDQMLFGSNDKMRSPSAEGDTGALDALVDLDRARHDDVHFHPPPEVCDLCRKSLAEQKYMIDGAVKGSSAWACMCAHCFLARGKGIAWGSGQLYLKDDRGWLEVGGFPPRDDSGAF